MTKEGAEKSAEDVKTFNFNIGGFKTIVAAIKVIGIPGFLVAFISTLFMIYGTKAQKREFIDQYILFKTDNDHQTACVIVIVGLMLIILITSVWFKRTERLMKAENNRIGAEKTKWEQLWFDKKLNSSKEID